VTGIPQSLDVGAKVYTRVGRQRRMEDCDMVALLCRADYVFITFSLCYSHTPLLLAGSLQSLCTYRPLLVGQKRIEFL
jgi:hypothetical protein